MGRPRAVLRIYSFPQHFSVSSFFFADNFLPATFPPYSAPPRQPVAAPQPYGFFSPMGICATKNFDAVVADRDNNRIMRFRFRRYATEDGGANRGTLIAQYADTPNVYLRKPVSVAIQHSLNTDDWDVLYVAEQDRYLLRYDGYRAVFPKVLRQLESVQIGQWQSVLSRDAWGFGAMGGRAEVEVGASGRWAGGRKWR